MEMEDILFGLDDGLLQFASSPSSPNVFEGIAPPHTYADFNESVQATLNAEESLLPNVDETFIKKAGTLTNLEVAVQRQQFSSVANATSLSPIYLGDIGNIDNWTLGDIVESVKDASPHAGENFAELLPPSRSSANAGQEDIPLEDQQSLTNMDTTPSNSAQEHNKKKRGRKPNPDKQERSKKPKMWELEDEGDPKVARAKAQREKREKHKAEMLALRQQLDQLQDENTQLKQTNLERQVRISELEEKLNCSTELARKIIKNNDSAS